MNHLFIVAHPDDEILGCLGTIMRLKEKKHRVAVAILSHASATRNDDMISKTGAIHREIGVDQTYFFDYEMMKFDTYDRYQMTKDIENVIEMEMPDVIYTHNETDIHNDHRTLFQIVLEASKLPLRGLGYNKPIKAIYTMEILSSTDWGKGFVPNAFVEVTAESIERKEKLLSLYDNVIRGVPFPRNAETFFALARFRGGQCGCLYAEAFRKIFEVDK